MSTGEEEGAKRRNSQKGGNEFRFGKSIADAACDFLKGRGEAGTEISNIIRRAEETHDVDQGLRETRRLIERIEKRSPFADAIASAAWIIKLMPYEAEMLNNDRFKSLD